MISNINEIAEELRSTIAIGQEVVTIGYYPTRMCKDLRNLGFIIRNVDNGVLYEAHILRIF